MYKFEGYYILFIFGIIGMYLTIRRFLSLNPGVSPPFLKYKKNDFEKELKKGDLDKYKDLLEYDNIFPLFYSSVFLSLIKINEKFNPDFITYTIPSHILLDWVENYIMLKMINYYQRDSEVKYNNIYFIISNVKWLLAGVNGSTSILSIINLIYNNF